MYTANTLPQLENQSLHLTEEDLKDLYGVLKEFFSFFHLQDMRELLWDWLVAALSTDSGAYSTGYARSNLIFIYEKLGLLIEASHALLKNREKTRKKESTQLEKGKFNKEFLNHENLRWLATRSEFMNAADLTYVLQNIVMHTRAEKVYLVDYHRGIEKERSFDMLVVHAANQPSKGRDKRVKLPPNLHRDIFAGTIWSEHHEQVKQTLREGHIFFSAVCRAQYLLYDTGRIELPEGSRDVRNMLDKAQKAFELHHSASTAFLAGAQHFTESGQFPFAANLLLQAVEQNLQALLQGLTPYDNSDYLGSLMLNCRNLFPQFWDIFPRITLKDETLFELLSTAYRGAKFNGSYKIDALDLAVLTGRVNNLHSMVPIVFQQQLTALEKSLSQP